jgi:hypothetical protein
MGGDRLEREISVIALAQQDTERALTLPAISGGRRKPPAQHRDRAIDLAPVRAVLVLRERVGDHVTIDTTGEQGLPDPIGAPLGELALVLDEQPCETTVVQEPLVGERLDRPLDVPRIDALSQEMAPHLRLRALPRVQITVRNRERPFEPGVRARRPAVGVAPCRASVDRPRVVVERPQLVVERPLETGVGVEHALRGAPFGGRLLAHSLERRPFTLDRLDQIAVDP